MRLSAKTIKSFANINDFDYSNEWIIRANEPNTLYFQLVDLDHDGQRYMPTGSPYGVAVTFPSIDSTQVITVNAVQADALDRSLWKIDLSSLQTPNSGNVQFSVFEGSAVRRFSLLNGISVEYPQNEGSC